MVLKRCLNALFSVLYGEMLFGTIGYKELRDTSLLNVESVKTLCVTVARKEVIFNVLASMQCCYRPLLKAIGTFLAR